MPEIAVTTLPGPRGPYHVAASERGVVAAAWGCSRDAFERRLEARLGTPLVESAGPRAVLDAVMPVLRRVLSGDAADATSVPLDLADRPAFDRRVLVAVRDIPWGRTASYGEIAARVGAPRAARAVGGAIGRNPVALLIPCHRVIAADGTLGGYGGDGPVDRAEALDVKRDLLGREGITVARSGR